MFFPQLSGELSVSDLLSQSPKKAIFLSFFDDLFDIFSINLAPSGAKYCEKKAGPLQKGWETPFGTF